MFERVGIEELLYILLSYTGFFYQ